ncbi:MAG: acetyl-CoA synthase subunit gamma [Bacteroidetes bacterium]|nr:acetyl-CoA synthase subunit gamma [Bacteroidota bacterium]
MKTNTRQGEAGKSNDLFIIQQNVTISACGRKSDMKNPDVFYHNHFITGEIPTPAGMIPQISTKLDVNDYLGAFMVRWGIRRDRYRVAPGLYAIGTPNEYSDVFVSANYKLTFDEVRKYLKGLNAWLLILDTKGVNVWCSAGKGTFGTKELVYRICAASLDRIVKHRRLILPQLGATGVAAHLVKEQSGFTVIYGPVRISDVHSFIHAGYKATKEMRRVFFGWYDRAKLIPNDIVQNIRYLLIIFFVLLVLSGINIGGYSIGQALGNTITVIKMITAGYIAGLLFTPLFLPLIPVQNFAFKGLIIGAVLSLLMLFNSLLDGSTVNQIAQILFILSFSSFLAMNFTGTSTYTSLAGVKKEMRIAVPIQIMLAVSAVILFILEITV